MERGLVSDDDVPGGGIGLADLAQERRVNVLVDGRGKEQFHPVGTVDLERLVHVTPLVACGSSTRSPQQRRITHS